MPIHDMLYRCPRCGHDPLDGHEEGARCVSCGTQFEQGRGAVIIVRPPDGPLEQSTASDLLADVERLGGPVRGTQLGEESLFREARIAFGRAEGHDVIRWRGEVLGFSERISRKGMGSLRLEGEALSFKPEQGPARGFSCLLSDIRGVQISSRALQVALDGGRLYQFEFTDDSPKRWEDLLCLALTRLYAQGGQCVAEFKPRIVIERDPHEA
jgi:DNA-directed RNA polymerase subunit RPC12/RpoP